MQPEFKAILGAGQPSQKSFKMVPSSSPGPNDIHPMHDQDFQTGTKGFDQ